MEFAIKTYMISKDIYLRTARTNQKLHHTFPSEGYQRVDELKFNSSRTGHTLAQAHSEKDLESRICESFATCDIARKPTIQIVTL